VLVADPALLSLGLGIALSLLAIGELLRSAGAPLASTAFAAFQRRFDDARDAGAAITISHLSLVAGVAAPLWMALEYASMACTAAVEAAAAAAAAAAPRLDPALLDNYHTSRHTAATTVATSVEPVYDSAPSYTTAPPLLAAWAGLLALGVADSTAATVGSLLGRTRVYRGSQKTLEGAVAGVTSLAACVAGVFALRWAHVGAAAGVAIWWRVVWFALLTGGLEAVTLQLDNLVVPLHACILCMVLL
jgi:dolichol kinase